MNRANYGQWDYRGALISLVLVLALAGCGPGFEMDAPKEVRIGEKAPVTVRAKNSPTLPGGLRLRWRTARGRCDPQESGQLSSTYFAPQEPGIDRVIVEVFQGSKPIFLDERPVKVIGGPAPEPRAADQPAAEEGEKPPKGMGPQQVTSQIAQTLTIEVPREGEVIRTAVYDDMRGAYEGELPSGYRLWVLAQDRYNFFLMYPPTDVRPVQRRWRQGNVRLATLGRWELHVCVANEAASRWLEERASRNDWSGFPTLPEGMVIVRSVTVKRSSVTSGQPVVASSPVRKSPRASVTPGVIKIDPKAFRPQGEEFFLDVRYKAISGLPVSDGVDLSNYDLEFTFGGGDGRLVQLWYKDQRWANVYSKPYTIISNRPIRYNPMTDGRDVDEFSDFTHIYAIGAKVFEGVEGVRIVSANLIIRRPSRTRHRPRPRQQSTPVAGPASEPRVASATPEPRLTIRITQVPPCDPIGGPDTSADIAGEVSGADPGRVRVVVYARTDYWYVQPLIAAPFTQIGQEGKWSTWTHTGCEYAALLVRPSYDLPARIPALPPAGGNVLAVTKVRGRGNRSALRAPDARLQQVASQIAQALAIEAPGEGEISGTYEGELPSGYQLWVLAQDRYNFFLMYPPPDIRPIQRRWKQRNVSLATPGRWELHICVANGAASRWLEERARRNDWSGFPSLPEGMVIVRSVTVRRENLSLEQGRVGVDQ